MSNQASSRCILHPRQSSVILLFLGVVCLLSQLAVADIHRAKTHTGKVSPYPSSQLKTNRQKADVDGGGDGSLLRPYSGDSVEELTAEAEGLQAWVCALLATTLVGLTGTFPLLLPIDVGPDNEGGAARFKCLLSFAVGGLLGDVFFHLMPEAWSHVAPDDHAGQITIGLWVIFGIFGFLVLEKMFGDNEAEKEKVEDSGLSTKTLDTSHESEMHLPQNYSISNQTPSHVNGHILPKNNNKSRRRRKAQENGQGKRTNNETNGYTANGHALKLDGHHSRQGLCVDTPKVEGKGSKVKVTGYLNLLANFIDNFTHGLAVAGSFLVSKKCGLLTTAAILLHEIPHEIGDFAILLRSGFDRWRAAKAQVFTATGGLCGALLALMSESAEKAGDSAAWILPFTSGGFLNIALVTVLPDLLEETNPRETVKQIFCLLCGIGIMGAVNLVVD